MNRDRRAVLEAIAYGNDRTIRPSERLRAIELLAEATPPLASSPRSRA